MRVFSKRLRNREQQYAELKTGLGLYDVVGRSIHGWHRHLARTAVACAFLPTERERRETQALTFPREGAVMTEILTAQPLRMHRRHLSMLLRLADIPLRISRSCTGSPSEN
jgi:hypothetical protein